MTKCRLPIILFISLFILSAGPTKAQGTDRLTLSITPPLIKNNVNPGQLWKSTVKLVNNNPVPIKAYVRAVDFRGGEESGTVQFLKNTETDQSATSSAFASTWLIIESGPIEIPPNKSQEIPFIVEVPDDADPGGHYVALLTGTKPPEKTVGSSLKVSSLIATLLLLNVSGDIKEEGSIREFSVDKSIFSEPDVNFRVRFYNQGNVHIQPQGEIKIFNPYDEEIGSITINHQTEFGNVLPGGIRRWDYNWQGERNILEMGKYRAELVLSFGEEAKKTVDRTIYFWIIYWQPLLIALGALAVLILVIILLIKLYIRRAVAATREQIGLIKPKSKENKKSVSVIPQRESGVVDLKDKLKKKTMVKVDSPRSGMPVLKLILILSLILFVVAAGGFIYLYLSDVEPIITEINDQPETGKDAGMLQDITGPEDSTTTEVEEINGNSEKTEKSLDKSLTITMLNGSGRSGLAKQAAELLEAEEWNVVTIGNADSFNHPSSELYYKNDFSVEAKAISSNWPGDIVIKNENNQESDLVIIVGSDFK